LSSTGNSKGNIKNKSSGDAYFSFVTEMGICAYIGQGPQVQYGLLIRMLIWDNLFFSLKFTQNFN